MSDSAPRRAWQRMLSGRRLDLIDPSPLDVEISDIAHGLARVARWNGQTKGPEIFSVAQHSLLVEALFAAGEAPSSRKARLAALLHDAPEYVIGDMISPFKAAVGGDYKRGRGAPQACSPHPLRLDPPNHRMISSAASRSPTAPQPISRRPRLPASRLRRRANCSVSPTFRCMTSLATSSRPGRPMQKRDFSRVSRNSTLRPPQPYNGATAGTASCLDFMSVRLL